MKSRPSPDAGSKALVVLNVYREVGGPLSRTEGKPCPQADKRMSSKTGILRGPGNQPPTPYWNLSPSSKGKSQLYGVSELSNDAN